MTSETRTGQLDLFDVGKRTRRHTANPCTPAPVGSGPKGRKCRDCTHCARVGTPAGNAFLKCGLMEHAWTNGAGSDIRAGWEACRAFELRKGTG